jgi:hypothetical protein
VLLLRLLVLLHPANFVRDLDSHYAFGAKPAA